MLLSDIITFTGSGEKQSSSKSCFVLWTLLALQQAKTEWAFIGSLQATLSISFNSFQILWIEHNLYFSLNWRTFIYWWENFIFEIIMIDVIKRIFHFIFDITGIVSWINDFRTLSSRKSKMIYKYFFFLSETSLNIERVKEIYV